jgi:hypothetical protein
VPVSFGQTKLQVSAEGEYSLEAKVLAPDEGANSLWIDFDSDPSGDNSRCWDITVGSGWNTQEVTWRLEAPKIWALSAGEHVLHIVQREPAQIESVTFRLESAPPVQSGGLYSEWLDRLAAWIEQHPAQAVAAGYSDWLDEMATWIGQNPAVPNAPVKNGRNSSTAGRRRRRSRENSESVGTV